MMFRDPNTLVKVNEFAGAVSAIVQSGQSLDLIGHVDSPIIDRYAVDTVVFLDGSDRFVNATRLDSDGKWLATIEAKSIGNDNSALKLQAFAASGSSEFVFPLRIDPIALETYSNFVKSLLPADSKDVPSIRAELRELITKATKVPYVARSIFQSIQTGNNYQTINFGQAQQRGGRPSRETFLFQIDLRGKKVLDIGANTGENSRIARRLGASLVDGYEYDPFFVEIGRAINAAAGMTRVSLFQGDCTRGELYTGMKYDIVLALAVWVYIQPAMKQIAEITDTLIFETHTLDHGMDYYYGGVLPFFPFAISMGLTEKPKDPHKSRMFVVFGKDRAKISSLVRREFLWVRPYFNNQFIKSYSGMDKNGITKLAESFLQKHGTAAESYLPGDYRFGARTYFEVFLAGFAQFLACKKKVDLENIYLNFLRHGIASGQMDSALTEIANNDAWIVRKVANKYEDTLNIINGNVDFVPPVEIVPDDSGPMEFTATDGKTYKCKIFDGHHRFFACELAGVEKIHYKVNS